MAREGHGEKEEPGEFGDAYPYLGVPLVPGIMAELAVGLFEGGMAKRSEIVA